MKIDDKLKGTKRQNGGKGRKEEKGKGGKGGTGKKKEKGQGVKGKKDEKDEKGKKGKRKEKGVRRGFARKRVYRRDSCNNCGGPSLDGHGSVVPSPSIFGKSSRFVSAILCKDAAA